MFFIKDHTISQVRLIPGGEALSLCATDGTETIHEREIFPVCGGLYDGRRIPDEPSPEILVTVCEINRDGPYGMTFSGFDPRYELACLTASQISVFLNQYAREWVLSGWDNTCFLVKKQTEMFVLRVNRLVTGGLILVRHQLGVGPKHKWRFRRRVVVPRLQFST